MLIFMYLSHKLLSSVLDNLKKDNLRLVIKFLLNSYKAGVGIIWPTGQMPSKHFWPMTCFLTKNQLMQKKQV